MNGCMKMSYNIENHLFKGGFFIYGILGMNFEK